MGNKYSVVHNQYGEHRNSNIVVDDAEMCESYIIGTSRDHSHDIVCALNMMEDINNSPKKEDILKLLKGNDNE